MPSSEAWRLLVDTRLMVGETGAVVKVPDFPGQAMNASASTREARRGGQVPVPAVSAWRDLGTAQACLRFHAPGRHELLSKR